MHFPNHYIHREYFNLCSSMPNYSINIKRIHSKMAVTHAFWFPHASIDVNVNYERINELELELKSIASGWVNDANWRRIRWKSPFFWIHMESECTNILQFGFKYFSSNKISTLYEIREYLIGWLCSAIYIVVLPCCNHSDHEYDLKKKIENKLKKVERERGQQSMRI